MDEYVAANRAMWNRRSAEYQRAHAVQLEREPRAWGTWSIPEAELGVLGDLTGRDVLELACGGAAWSIALAREGARAVGIDLSEGQLAYAASRRAEAGVTLPLIQANALSLPFADGSFDVVFCDHGAMSWADPYGTVPEAARVLRPHGLLAFNATSPWAYACLDEQADRVGDALRRPYFGMHGWDEGGGSRSFLIEHGEWVRLFRAHGLVVEDFVELRRPAGAGSTYTAPDEWYERWPGEQLWKVRKLAGADPSVPSIRSCTACDVEVLEAAMPSGAARRHEARYKDQQRGESILLVAWLGLRPVGHVQLRWSPAYEPLQSEFEGPEVGSLGVAADVRRRGIGTALIGECERLARVRGHDRICIGAGLDNPGAQRLYERLGYRDWGGGHVNVWWVELDDRGDERRYEEICRYLTKPLS